MKIEKKQDAGRKGKVKIKKVKMVKRNKALERKGARAHVIAQCSLYHVAFYYTGFGSVNCRGSQIIAYGNIT